MSRRDHGPGGALAPPLSVIPRLGGNAFRVLPNRADVAGYLSLDFSTYYVPSVTPAQAQGLVTAGFQHAWIGFDSSMASQGVRASIVGAGMLWSTYRFIYPGLPIDQQIGDILTGIHQGPQPLPLLLALDIEEYQGVAPSIAQIEQAMSLLDAAQVTPTDLVRPAIYSSPGIWAKWYPGYTGPAQRGYLLIDAEWNGREDLGVTLYGGWTMAQVVGHQYQADAATAVGSADLDWFGPNLVASPTPVPLPPPVEDWHPRVEALEAWRGAIKAAS